MTLLAIYDFLGSNEASGLRPCNQSFFLELPNVFLDTLESEITHTEGSARSSGFPAESGKLAQRARWKPKASGRWPAKQMGGWIERRWTFWGVMKRIETS